MMEKVLHLNLQVTRTKIEVASIEGESGCTLTMTFDRNGDRDLIVKRVGSEVLSWIELMEDELEDMGEDEDGE